MSGAADKVSGSGTATCPVDPLYSEAIDAAFPSRGRRNKMLHYAVVFFVIALIAALFGFGGLAAGAAGIAKILFLVFVVMAVATFLVGLVRK